MTHPDNAAGPRFTAGPWKLSSYPGMDTDVILFRENNGDFVVVTDRPEAEDGKRVAAVSFQATAKRGQTFKAQDPEGLANANLVAAAPTMLAALQETVLQLQYLADKFGETGTGASVLARVHAAITKAEGRHP